MRTGIIIFVGMLLFAPTTITAKELTAKYEAMDIETLIEISKTVSDNEKNKIDKVIKRKIAKAQRDKIAKG
ncbi:MAG TPA: hypothetical protein ENK86_02265 [Campylobacterales bacterium]|nr:hypothetical protein [Campylobacterales bacterium]